MNRFQCEMFGHFSYDDSLSYHDLLDVESAFMGRMETLLAEWGAEHIDYTPMGEGLMVQCAFERYAPENFSSLGERLCENVPPAMEGRLLFVDKRLETLHVYHVAPMVCVKNTWAIPALHEALAQHACAQRPRKRKK